MLTKDEVLLRLRGAVNEAGGLHRFGDQYGFTASYISDVLRGKRGLADRILATIGVEREIVYKERKEY